MATAAPAHPSETEKPEEHIREESLHKASTDLTAFDVADVAPDIYVVESTILVRGDSEDAARGKFLATIGIHADVPGGSDAVKVRKAKPSDIK